MNKNLWIGSLIVALAILGVVLVRQNRQLTQLQNTPPPPPTVVTQVVNVVRHSVPVNETPVPPPAETAPEAPTGASSVSNVLSGLAGMMKNPQFKEMIRAQQAMMVDKMYGSLSKYLTLSADQSAALKQLLLDRQTALTDAGLAMMNGSDADKLQAAADTKSVKADYDAKIQALLGPQDYPVFQQYEDTQPERMQIELFKGQLSGTDSLTDQQEGDLTAAMYQARKNLPADSMVNNQTPDPSKFTEAGMADMLKQQEQLQKQYADAAATVLTASQLDQFAKFQSQMQAMQAAGAKMAAQMFATTPAPAPVGAPVTP